MPAARERCFLEFGIRMEIVLKHAAGKLSLPEAPATYVPSRRKASSILPLHLDERAIFELANLPSIEGHKDPFDRMLVCQAMAHDLILVSPDRAFKSYPVEVLW